jgi:hypothetical protein
MYQLFSECITMYHEFTMHHDVPLAFKACLEVCYGFF